MTKFLLLPALSAALLAAAPALANDEAASRTVSIAPAELTTKAGAAAVHARISQAALAACRAENRGGAAFERSVRICAADTVARTVAAIDAPLLTAEHAEQPERIRLASLLR
jgi:UrcA family protein